MRERTVALVISFLFLISAFGRADSKYTQSGQVTGGRGMNVLDAGGTATTTYVKGACLRIDLPSGRYGIVDLNGRREIQVDPTRSPSEIRLQNLTFFRLSVSESRMLGLCHCSGCAEDEFSRLGPRF